MKLLTSISNRTKVDLKKILTNDTICEIVSRLKDFFSFWKGARKNYRESNDESDFEEEQRQQRRSKRLRRSSGGEIDYRENKSDDSESFSRSRRRRVRISKSSSSDEEENEISLNDEQSATTADEDENEELNSNDSDWKDKQMKSIKEDSVIVAYSTETEFIFVNIHRSSLFSQWQN